MLESVFLKRLAFVLPLAISTAHATPTTLISSDGRQCYPDAASAYTALMTAKRTTAIININTATTAEFIQLEGVGPNTATAIVAYREQHGRFGSVDELIQVKGIGQRTLDKNRARLKVW